MSRILNLRDGTLDLDRLQVERDGARQGLTATEGALLAYLAGQAHRDVPRAELLEQVWGYAPHVVTRAIDKTVARLRKKIEADPAVPQHLVTVHGTGYRWVGSALAPVAAATRFTGCAQQFVGRDAQRAQLAAALSAGPLVSVVGPPGIGKTRLVREVLPGGARPVHWCRPDDAADPDAGLASALETDVPGLAARLAASAGLVVLDGWEAGPGVAERVWGWVKATRGAAFVRTGYAPLGLTDERVIRVGPLDDDASRALLVELLEHHAPGRPAADPGLAAVVQAAQGVPLALELAAARARTAPLDVVAASAGPDDRLADAIARGLDALPASLVEPLEHLAGWAGPLELGLARELLGEDAVPVLGALTDGGLVEFGPEGWTVLEPIRRAVLARLEPAQRAARVAAATAVLAGLLGEVPLLSLWGEGHEGARQRLRLHAPAVLSAAGDAPALEPLAACAARLLGRSAPIEPPPPGPAADAAAASRQVLHLEERSAAHFAASLPTDEVQALHRWPALACRALRVVGRSALWCDDLPRAREAWWQGMGLAEDARDRRWQLRMVAELAVLAGAERRGLLEDALAAAGELDEPQLAARIALDLVGLQAARGPGPDAAATVIAVLDGLDRVPTADPGLRVRAAVRLVDVDRLDLARACLEAVGATTADGWVAAVARVHLASIQLQMGQEALAYRRISTFTHWDLPPRVRTLAAGVREHAAAAVGAPPHDVTLTTSNLDGEVGLAACHLGHAHRLRDDPEGAAAWLERARACRRSTVLRPLHGPIEALRAAL